MRIGLVTNHTGRNREGRQTIDVLSKAPGVKLVALFSPNMEFADSPTEMSPTRKEATGLPIYSLYGETRRPKPSNSKISMPVYDIQDIGARFYTYIPRSVTCSKKPRR